MDATAVRERFDLAHFNLAFGRQPMDHPVMHDFVRQIDEVNRLAAASPGFLWTPADGAAGDPEAVFDSVKALANISTWRSVDDLRRFAYEGQHLAALRRRAEWFEAPTGPAYVLWWVPAGGCPDFAEGKARLERLAAEGPTPAAFDFAHVFAPIPLD